VGAYAQGQIGTAREGYGCYARDDPSLEGERSRKRLEEVAQELNCSSILTFLAINLHKSALIIGGTLYRHTTIVHYFQNRWAFGSFSRFLRNSPPSANLRRSRVTVCFGSMMGISRYRRAQDPKMQGWNVHFYSMRVTDFSRWSGCLLY